METLLKLGAGAAIVWFLLGGRGALEPKQRASLAPPDTVTAIVTTVAAPRTPAVAINSLEFLQDHSKYILKMNAIQVGAYRLPRADEPTAAGSISIPWQTLSVNPFDFPLSVPEEERRKHLTGLMAAEGKRAPAPRAFLVLEFPNGEKYLTETSDTGSVIKSGTVAWHIRDEAVDLAFLQTLGENANAVCFILDDAFLTFEEVRLQSQK